MEPVSATRLLLYNIRYGMGLGPGVHWPLPGVGSMADSRGILRHITNFIKGQNPDIVGLVEVDGGSIRSRRVNQADTIARALGHYSVYQCKYGESSLNQFLPIVRKQGNAFLAAPHVHGARFHYFDKGIKRLIIELELADCAIFLVHLSLRYGHRQDQLHALRDFVGASTKPVLIAGDFNTLRGGKDEIRQFMKASGLRNANVRGLPSYPSPSPRKELDFVLYGDGIDVTGFFMPGVQYSDHLPLVCDFRVGRTSLEAA